MRKEKTSTSVGEKRRTSKAHTSSNGPNPTLSVIAVNGKRMKGGDETGAKKPKKEGRKRKKERRKRKRERKGNQWTRRRWEREKVEDSGKVHAKMAKVLRRHIFNQHRPPELRTLALE